MAYKNPKTPLGHHLPWILLGLYCLFGLWGHLEYIDDTSAWRLLMLTYAGMPLAITALSIQFMYPEFFTKWRRLRMLSVGCLWVFFCPGYILTLNSLGKSTDKIKRTVLVQGTIAVRDVERGRLGILFTRRW